MGQLGGGGVDSLEQGGPSGAGDKKKNRKWGVGEMEFEAMMRMMDNAVSSFWDFPKFLNSKRYVVVSSFERYSKLF